MEQARNKKVNVTKKNPHPFILQGGDVFLNIFSQKQKEGAARKRFPMAS